MHSSSSSLPPSVRSPPCARPRPFRTRPGSVRRGFHALYQCHDLIRPSARLPRRPDPRPWRGAADHPPATDRLWHHPLTLRDITLVLRSPPTRSPSPAPPPHSCPPSRRTTTPGHWEGWSGTERKASEMSRTAACEPGGSMAQTRETAKNVPQVHGNSEASMAELMEETR